MTAFSDAAAQLPHSFVVVPPSAFKSDWEDRPKDDLCVGLRLVSHQDIQVARAQARERAIQACPDLDIGDAIDLQTFTDAYNDALMAHLVSQATCDPNDVTAPWGLIQAAPEDMVREFMTSDGLKLIFDKWESMRISLDPTQREASDDEVAALATVLAEHGPSLSLVKRARVRRLLAFVLDELQPKP